MSKIVVVEDNLDNQLLLQAILGELFELKMYENGADFLEEIGNDNPDLVLMDISLPEMDGTEVLARLRSFESLSKLPVVAVTAHAMAGDRRKYLRMGFTDYVSKPILDVAGFIEMIKEHLNSHTS